MCLPPFTLLIHLRPRASQGKASTVGNDVVSLLLHCQIHHSFSIVPTPFANSNTPHKFSPTEAALLHIALQIPNILLFPIASVSLENKEQICLIWHCAKEHTWQRYGTTGHVPCFRDKKSHKCLLTWGTVLPALCTTKYWLSDSSPNKDTGTHKVS